MNAQLICPLDAERLLRSLPGWTMAERGHAIRREYELADFMEAVRLIERIAPLAEAANHHPDLSLTGYRRLAVVLSTRSAGGLTEKDFALASRIEAVAAPRR